MKQTAIEWLTEKLRAEFGFAFSDNILEQAKEMERKQIIDSYEEGYFDKKTAEQYYNQTFKQ
jgi:HEPN domain-containing protein